MKSECPPSIHILIVEDNKADVLLLKEFLGMYRLNNRISWASDGEEALKMIQEENPHLVILDMHLPKKSGMEVLNEVKSGGECDPTKFVIMAGSNQQIDLLRTMVPHADAFIVKPFTLETLASMVSQLDCFAVSIVELPYDPATHPCPNPGI